MRRPAPRGSALLLVMAISAAMLTVGAVVFMRVEAFSASHQDELKRTQLLWLARSGVAEGRARRTDVILPTGERVAVQVTLKGTRTEAVAQLAGWGVATVQAEKSGRVIKGWEERFVPAAEAR